ncbi:MAG: type II toxin-antitoxin system RelB/DinJ family antitoxin [Clostridiales Family XIII bacterium]|jgi:addiction module RelB/DinJ family antitoxin|nr:type II toxin-antitoxin system RelB/DinJ family antitoxin [Clostridiales Family XIII bacterium]
MEAQRDVRVTIRMDRELKESAENLFRYLGINMSNAISMFLRKSVDEKGIPFSVGRSDAAGDAGGEYDFSPDNVTKAFAESVSLDVYSNLKRGIPVAQYDTSKKKAYLLHPDGTREYV